MLRRRLRAQGGHPLGGGSTPGSSFPKRLAIGLGNFREVIWHQKLKENILRAVGVKVEYGEEPIESQDRRIFKTISDAEHAEIMALYLDENKSMAKIQAIKKRSRSTIHTQITNHNEAVARSGFCPKCKRVHGSHAKENNEKLLH